MIMPITFYNLFLGAKISQMILPLMPLIMLNIIIVTTMFTDTLVNSLVQVFLIITIKLKSNGLFI